MGNLDKQYKLWESTAAAFTAARASSIIASTVLRSFPSINHVSKFNLKSSLNRGK